MYELQSHSVRLMLGKTVLRRDKDARLVLLGDVHQAGEPAQADLLCDHDDLASLRGQRGQLAHLGVQRLVRARVGAVDVGLPGGFHLGEAERPPG